MQHVAEHGSLREGVEDARPEETVWTLNSPEVYRLLTVDRGWSGEEYSAWLADSLIMLLLL